MLSWANMLIWDYVWFSKIDVKVTIKILEKIVDITYT